MRSGDRAGTINDEFVHPKEAPVSSDLGVWKAEDCALLLIDYQKEMFEVIRSEPNADLVEMHVRLLAKTAKAYGVPIEELRKARSLSQEDMAATMAVGQPAVARLEKRNDMHVSNLRRYVEALGGTLAITAHFPDGAVTIADVGEAEAR